MRHAAGDPAERLDPAGLLGRRLFALAQPHLAGEQGQEHGGEHQPQPAAHGDQKDGAQQGRAIGLQRDQHMHRPAVAGDHPVGREGPLAAGQDALVEALGPAAPGRQRLRAGPVRAGPGDPAVHRDQAPIAVEDGRAPAPGQLVGLQQPAHAGWGDQGRDHRLHATGPHDRRADREPGPDRRVHDYRADRGRAGGDGVLVTVRVQRAVRTRRQLRDLGEAQPGRVGELDLQPLRLPLPDPVEEGDELLGRGLVEAGRASDAGEHRDLAVEHALDHGRHQADPRPGVLLHRRLFLAQGDRADHRRKDQQRQDRGQQQQDERTIGLHRRGALPCGRAPGRA